MSVEWAGIRDVSSPTPFYDSCLRLLPELSHVSDLTSKIYAHLLKTVASPPALPFEWSCFISSNFFLMRHWSLLQDSFSENLN